MHDLILEVNKTFIFPHFNAIKEFRFTRARNSYKNYVPSKFNISERYRPCVDTAER